MKTVCKPVMPFAAHATSSLIPYSCRSSFCFVAKISRQELAISTIRARCSLSGIRASATVQSTDTKLDVVKDADIDIFACPICYMPLIRRGPPGLNLSSILESGFQCKRCKKRYFARDVFLDLTITAGFGEYLETRPVSVETFRNPLVSFLYERGWRQNFERSGFPGPDEEFRMAQKYFEPAFGGLLVDASCGSGLFSRRFLSCGLYSGVIALDFSENMLRQCYDFIQQDKNISTEKLALVRADISRLPFPTDSIDAVHAGAALHCWPSPSTALAEICRVLKPGGVFVATTFLLPGYLDIIRKLRQALLQATGSVSYFTENQIKELCKACGLVDYACIRRQQFIMLRVRKPSQSNIG
eukprot:TRINITY_DN2500_c0_g1_i1.p1 TRINITY_DN2500_c0_g1~~TRINITY_DN2500_c0_g1_i1.p1  ORF type:complete len:357 (+),score=53.24 TRINITY_DN2500_c0_g1_i1:224-1294(+)